MEISQALTIAIAYEHKVRDHYMAAAEQVLDPRGRKVMETLGREEQGHVEYLESRLEEWRHRGAIADTALPTLLPGGDWLEQARRRLEKAPGADVAVGAELDLLKRALELEKQTSGFYRELVGTLPVGQRELFARFLEIEEGHVAIVQAEIDAVSGLGTWFDLMEISLEAG